MEIVNDESPVTKHHEMKVVNDTVIIEIITKLTLSVDTKMTLVMEDYD